MSAMTDAPLTYRWSRDEFVRAWEAGAFDRRVELIEGEVWPVVIGQRHGFTVGHVAGLLHRFGERISMATLPAGDSLPDPDCWVLRAGAEPIEAIGSKLAAWDPSDVLLVVEVADESVMADLNIKTRLYGRAGYPVYWVVTREAIYEHTGPHSGGYHARYEYLPGDQIPVRYADTVLAVNDLIAP